MTIKNAIVLGTKSLHSSGTPLLDTEILLGFVLQKPKEYLLSHDEEILSKSQEKQFQGFLEERQRGKPIAYITHEKEFFGRSFYVDERVLIPRPETEEMVEDAIQFLKKHSEITTIIDLGTGSGCIGITVALEFPEREVIGLDISSDALAVARKNAKLLKCKNVEFLQSDLLGALYSVFSIPTKPRARSDAGRMEESLVSVLHQGIPQLVRRGGLARNGKLVILANLPYVGTETNRYISDETLRYEPHEAIFGGYDGLELYRKTWEHMKTLHLPVAALFMEIGFCQQESMEKEAKEAFPNADLKIKNDLAGLPRTAMLIF